MSNHLVGVVLSNGLFKLYQLGAREDMKPAELLLQSLLSQADLEHEDVVVRNAHIDFTTSNIEVRQDQVMKTFMVAVSASLNDHRSILRMFKLEFIGLDHTMCGNEIQHFV